MTETLLFFVILYKPCCKHLQASRCATVGNHRKQNAPVEPIVLAAGDESRIQHLDGLLEPELLGIDGKRKNTQSLECS